MSIREKKKAVVEEIKNKLQDSTVAVLADYRGLSVTEISNLRSQLRETGTDLKVTKNTMTRLAAQELGIEGLDPYLEGPTAIAYNSDDPVTPAKILLKFAKENKALEIKSAVLDGKVIDFDAVKALADLPSREQLLAKLLGSMQAPMYGFANVLQGNIRNLVYVLEAVRKKQAEAGEA